MSSERESGDKTNAELLEPSPGGDARGARRRLVKALVGSGSILASGKMLPEQWTRPVVESVLLPAHAQATGVLSGVFTTQNRGAGPAPGSAGSILDFFIAPAAAGLEPCNAFQGLTISVSGSSAQICVHAAFGNESASTTVSGLKLANTSTPNYDLKSMSGNSAGTEISGFINNCEFNFTCTKVNMAYSCPINVTAEMTLSASRLA
jgi:hypothetical protein